MAFWNRRTPPVWIRDLPAEPLQKATLRALARRCRTMPRSLADLLNAHKPTDAELAVVIAVMRQTTQPPTYRS